MVRRDPRKSQNSCLRYHTELSRRCNRTEQRTRRRHATVTAPFRLHVIDVGLLRTGCVIRGVG